MDYVLVAGYRPSELGIFNEKHPGIPFIKMAIERRLRSLISDGLKWVIVTGMPGISYWTTDIVTELKKEFPYLKLAIIEPFEQHLEEQKRETYMHMVLKANYHEILDKRPYENPNQLRQHNQALIFKSEALILLYDSEMEGSPKFLLDMANKKQARGNYLIYMINQYDLQDMVEEYQSEQWSD
jgi:uncharacterized phage-like protein YoqJ